MSTRTRRDILKLSGGLAAGGAGAATTVLAPGSSTTQEIATVLGGPHMSYGRWGQQMCISDRDICHAMERAVLAEDVPYAVLNLMSDDPGMRWDIDETRRLIGYQPTDSHVAIVSEDQMKTEALAYQAYIATQMLQEGFVAWVR